MIWACGYGIIPVIIFGFAGYEIMLLKEIYRLGGLKMLGFHDRRIRKQNCDNGVTMSTTSAPVSEVFEEQVQQ
jgi:hypothetical protein